MKPARMAKAVGLLALLICFGFSNILANQDPFPTPDVIAPNVAFWVKVYSKYPTSKGIVHDNLDLNIIYEVIDLLPYNASGADTVNRPRMKAANGKYEQILRRLAEDPTCGDPECRRVAELFPAPRSASQFQQAVDRVRCQIGQMDRFKEGLVRSGAYIDQIRSVFKSYNLPEDLAYLPHVESSFNPNAYSKVGAAGMWQFTQSTGKRYMQVGYTVDERRDPVLATHAAAQLLRENYGNLEDWPLAVTAYNHGTSGMMRAKGQHGDYAKVFQSYQSPSFKFASRNFYSEFLAAREVASNYKKYFGELALANPVPCRTHVLDGFVSFSKLSQHFGVSPEVLQHLNPALRQPVVAGQKHVPKGYALRLPANAKSAETLMAGLIPESIYQKDQKPTRFYTVRRGDTLGKIAHSNGVEVNELVAANHLGKHATILPSQTLRIPSHGEKSSQPELPVVASNAPAPKTVTSKIEAAAPAKEAGAPAVKAVEPTEIAEQAVEAKVPAATAIPKAKAKPTAVPAAEAKAPIVATASQKGNATVQKNAPVVKTPAAVAELKAPVAEPKAPLIVAAVDPVVVAPQGSQRVKTPDPVSEAVPEPSKTEPETQNAISPIRETMPETPHEGSSQLKSDSAAPASVGTPFAQDHQPQPVLAMVSPGGSSAGPEKEGLTLEALRQQVSNDEIVVANVGFVDTIKVKRQPVGVIQVEIEETLGHYADWADVRTQEIRSLNGLSFNGVIHLHQKIKIPLSRVTAEAFEQSRYEFHKRLQEDFFAVYRIGELQDYYVQHGDNYWTLAQTKFEIPMWLLKHCNPETDLANLQINQKLIIPMVEKASNDDASPADEQGTQEVKPDQEEKSNAPAGKV